MIGDNRDAYRRGNQANAAGVNIAAAEEDEDQLADDIGEDEYNSSDDGEEDDEYYDENEQPSDRRPIAQKTQDIPGQDDGLIQVGCQESQLEFEQDEDREDYDG
jgi:hypothetical protein